MKSQNLNNVATFKKVYGIHRDAALRNGTLADLTQVGDVLIDSVHQKYTVEQVDEGSGFSKVVAVSHDSGEKYWIPREQTYRESRTADHLGITKGDTRHAELVAFNRGVQSRIDAGITPKVAVEMFGFLRRFVAETGIEGDLIGRILDTVDHRVGVALKIKNERGYEKHDAAGGILVRLTSRLDGAVREQTFNLPDDSDSWTNAKRSKRLRETVATSNIAIRSEPGVADTIWQSVFNAVKYSSGEYSLWRNPEDYEDFTEVEVITIPSHREQLEKSFIADGGLAPVSSGWL